MDDMNQYCVNVKLWVLAESEKLARAAAEESLALMIDPDADTSVVEFHIDTVEIDDFTE